MLWANTTSQSRESGLRFRTVLNQVVVVVGLMEQVTLEAAEEVGHVAILDKRAPCRGNSPWKGPRAVGTWSVQGTARRPACPDRGRQAPEGLTGQGEDCDLLGMK